MAPNPRRLDARLDALYAKLPRLECQGLCHDSCGPVDMSIRERARIRERTGREVTCGSGASCSMLTPDRRCGVYDIRPLICRLWGILDVLRCPYGCIPEGGHLSSEDGARLIAEADVIGGAPGHNARRQHVLRQMLEDPEAMRAAGEFLRRTAVRPHLGGRHDVLPGTVLHHKPPGRIDR